MRPVSDPDGIDELHRQWRAVVDGVERAQQRLLDAVEETGISAQWYAVLHALLHADNHRLPMSRLAREMSFTSGGFTKLADRIGREGLIDRRSSDGDRRVVYATLTPAGVLAARTAERAYVAALRSDLLTALPAEKLTVVADLLAALDDLGPVADVIDAAIVADPGQPRSLDATRSERRQHRRRTDSA